MTLTGVPLSHPPVGEVFPAQYLVRVQGCLEGAGWPDWFDPMQITVDLGQGETTLRGLVADQAELYGLLSKLRNLNLPLLLVQRVDGLGSTASPQPG